MDLRAGKEKSVQIHANKALCQGHARCEAAAPRVFSLDDDGYIAETLIEVPAGEEERARRGVMSCPERVLEISQE